MIDLTGVTHHPVIEEITDVLCAKTQNTNRKFFHAELAFFLGKMASSMRATIVTKDRGEIPVNMYVLALATSGFGKGHSVAIFEGDFLSGFKKRFMEETFPTISDQHLNLLAQERSIRNGTDQQVEYDSLLGEFKRAGAIPFTFDSGTAPAVKQLRHKLLMGNCGAINFQMDEVGSNLEGSAELMNLFLELYDLGSVKQKITKNTAENQRAEELDGRTPANVLLFGTPSKLLDGAKTEDLFYSFLDTGYARRCLFGWGEQEEKAHNTQSAEEIYRKLIQPSNSVVVDKWAHHFHLLADPAIYGWKMTVDDPVGILLWEYKIACEMAADQMKDHEEIRKAEMSHRYFKALKLAGALAFVDQSCEIEEMHLKQAILLVEESGESFQTILTREKSYVKLAKYIADMGTELTHADLHEALPFYKMSQGARNEQMGMAIGWGYKHHVIIKKAFRDGIEFFSGEKLAETNLDEIIVSYSDHWAYHYQGTPENPNERVPFDQLFNLTQAEGMHWANHHFKNGHRARENVVPGFNMIVIDVDGGTTLDVAHELLADYKFMTYTTKRHQTEGEDRFRIMIPMNYELKLDAEDYKAFMDNVMAWLPFKTDEGANQAERKWETFSGGSYHLNMEGGLLDVLPFIPRTSRNAEYQDEFKKVESLDNLERWFAQRMASGNRNNQMIKFALALVDSGLSYPEVQAQVHSFNKKLSNSLPSDEIDNTVMVTVAKKFQRA
jgi:hypothetical protein